MPGYGASIQDAGAYLNQIDTVINFRREHEPGAITRYR
jgi:hypothetical protein